MWDRWSDRPWKVCLLITLFALPYFLNLGASSLWDSNEAFYAETPREMLESGDYVTPHFNYTPRLQKPPLSYWIVAASYHLFGVSEFAERLPMALCALVVLGLTYAIAARLYGHSVGVSSALVLAGIGRFMITSRRSVIDMLLLLLVVA
ncbi:MAG: glycosyltransferase family 39 protein, partial [Acidobacteria bacterium]|nr:glycosyltransferase family 39 protein [Acidobacteriota bacterium]